jgi:DNA-binding transcriptional LysR family regulator
MEINYLKEFVALAEIGNFMEASEALFCSQSALSKHIKRMEKELGVLLFNRTTRKVEISKYGQLLLPYAKQISEIKDKYVNTIQSSLEADQETLTLGSIPDLAQYGITDVLVQYKKTCFPSNINVFQAGSEKLKEMLRQKKCELAFLRYTDEQDDDLVKIPYSSDHLVAVLPSGHTLAAQASIPLQNLAQEDFLLMEKETKLYRLSIKACEQSGFEPKIAYTDQKLGNLIDMVGKGMGIALMMKQLALYLSTPKIAVVDIAPIVTTTINLCHLKGVDLSEAATKFIACTANHVTEPGLINK